MTVNVLAQDLKFPEGPVVTPDGHIYFVELLGGCITEYRRDSQDLKRFDVGGSPNGLLVQDNQTLLFCDSENHAIRSLDIRTGKTKTLVDKVDGQPLQAPNDLIKDQEGNILFTCPGQSQNQPIGYICVINKNNQVSIIAENMYFPNGLLLINHDQHIIINETWQHRLLIGEWNKETLSIDHIQPFYHIGGKAEPDGLTLSKEKDIYAAVYGTGKIWVFHPNGKLAKHIELPGQNPTNLCFDNKNLGLIVTEAEKGMLLSIHTN